MRGWRGAIRLRETETPEAVDMIRANCRLIRETLVMRLQIGAPVPSSAVRATRWFTEWEQTDRPPASSNPWARFVSAAGVRDAATTAGAMMVQPAPTGSGVSFA